MKQRVRRKPEGEPYSLEWLMKWVLPEPNSGCWLWTGTLNPGGYGSVGYLGRTMNAHRAAYLVCGGDIPDGCDLDHLCRVRCCVNPSHLEPVSRSENLRRGNAGKNFIEAAIAKTRCPYGHEYAGSNLYVSKKGSRDCVICARARVRAWRQRTRAAAQEIAA